MASIAELRARLANLNKRTTKNPNIWKPSDEHDVRLLRNPHNDDPIEEVTFHYNVGDAREILCPKQFAEECVICDFADQLKAFRDVNGREKPKKDKDADWEVFKRIQAQTKVYVPMIERLDGGKGMSAPAWWGLTKNQSEQVLRIATDPEWLADCDIDPTDDQKAIDAIFSPSKAYDFHVSFKKPGEKENKKSFTIVEITPKRKPSALTGERAKVTELIAQIRPIREVFPKVPVAEIELTLKKFVGGGMKVDDPKASKKDEKYPVKSKERAEAAGARSVEDAFGDLLEGTESK
jgi:hypothetical protein